MKDTTGQSLNVYEQEVGMITKSLIQDAHEYLTSFLDRIDQALQYTNQPRLIKSLFRGTLIDRLICPHCGEIRHSEVPFTNLSVEVKDVSRLEDSLKRFGESEIIDGLIH